MRSKIFFLFVICMLTLSAAADLHAQVKAGSFSVSPFAGYTKFAKTSYYEAATVYGGSLGYNFSETFGIEVTYNTLDTEVIPEGIVITTAAPPGPPPPGFVPTTTVIAPGGAKVSGSQIRIEGLYYVYTGNKFAPYVAMGIGTRTLEYEGIKDARTNAPVGFGFKYFFTDTIALRADVRSVIPVHFNNLLISSGVTFQFGGK